MKAVGLALWIVGYAVFYTGASNLFTGGQGWGFLQSLINIGTSNQSGSISNSDSGSKHTGTGTSLNTLFQRITPTGP